MKALETGADISAAAKAWQQAFGEGAEIIGLMSGKDVIWHDRLEIWGMFGKTTGKGESSATGTHSANSPTISAATSSSRSTSRLVGSIKIFRRSSPMTRRANSGSFTKGG